MLVAPKLSPAREHIVCNTRHPFVHVVGGDVVYVVIGGCEHKNTSMFTPMDVRLNDIKEVTRPDDVRIAL